MLLLALGQASWAKGLALGGLASAVNFALMAVFLPKAVGRGRGRAEAFSFFSLIIRFAVMGAALALALYYRPAVAVGACAAGLFMVQFTLVAERWLGRVWPAYFAGSR